MPAGEIKVDDAKITPPKRSEMKVPQFSDMDSFPSSRHLGQAQREKMAHEDIVEKRSVLLAPNLSLLHFALSFFFFAVHYNSLNAWKKLGWFSCKL